MDSLTVSGGIPLANLFRCSKADVSAQDFSGPLSANKRCMEGNVWLFGVRQQYPLVFRDNLIYAFGR
jgi:hypothetical protein